MQFVPYKIQVETHNVEHYTDNSGILIFNAEEAAHDFIMQKLKDFVAFKEGGEKADNCIYSGETLPSNITSGYYGLDNGSELTLFQKSIGYFTTSINAIAYYKIEKIKHNNIKKNPVSAPQIIQNNNNFNDVIRELSSFDKTKLKKISHSAPETQFLLDEDDEENYDDDIEIDLDLDDDDMHIKNYECSCINNSNYDDLDEILESLTHS